LNGFCQVRFVTIFCNRPMSDTHRMDGGFLWIWPRRYCRPSDKQPLVLVFPPWQVECGAVGIYDRSGTVVLRDIEIMGQVVINICRAGTYCDAFSVLRQGMGDPPAHRPFHHLLLLLEARGQTLGYSTCHGPCTTGTPVRVRYYGQWRR